jgi:hypothetical protein
LTVFITVPRSRGDLQTEAGGDLANGLAMDPLFVKL